MKYRNVFFLLALVAVFAVGCGPKPAPANQSDAAAMGPLMGESDDMATGDADGGAQDEEAQIATDDAGDAGNDDDAENLEQEDVYGSGEADGDDDVDDGGDAYEQDDASDLF
ncbi:MAG: hypothetical protein JXX14_12945 [Deltaproteobacteria bacterium]|nr:hypothetical protein [Deltaproteobacteria bacterium]